MSQLIVSGISIKQDEKGRYDINTLRQRLKERGIKAVIPPKSN